MAKHVRSRLLGAVGALMALAGCASTPSETTVVPLPDGRGPDSVVLDASFDFRVGLAMVSYTLHNNLDEPLWFVAHPVAPVLPDGNDGIAVALAAVPVRKDVNYAQPPTVTVQRLDASAQAEGSVRIELPFVPFSDREGDEELPLPTDPHSVRLCMGVVPESSIPAERAPREESGRSLLDQAVAFEQQMIVCSETAPIPEDIG